MQKIKKIEVSLRESKSKAQQAENLLSKKEKELDLLKAADEKRRAADEAYTIRDRQTFENHFGHKARPSEEKYVIFLRMYENQAEKMRKELQQLRDQVAQMDESGNGNSVRKSNFNHHAEGSQVNLERIAELEQVNSELKRTLQDNAQDFKDLLGQLDALRHDVQGKDAQIRDL